MNFVFHEDMLWRILNSRLARGKEYQQTGASIFFKDLNWIVTYPVYHPHSHTHPKKAPKFQFQPKFKSHPLRTLCRMLPSPCSLIRRCQFQISLAKQMQMGYLALWVKQNGCHGEYCHLHRILLHFKKSALASLLAETSDKISSISIKQKTEHLTGELSYREKTKHKNKGIRTAIKWLKLYPYGNEIPEVFFLRGKVSYKKIILAVSIFILIF